MSELATKYGVLVGVDGSAASIAAIEWAAREASLRQEAVTLMHAAQPMLVNWPSVAERVTVAQRQEDNARRVIEQARRLLDAAAIQQHPNDVRTEVRYAHPVDALLDAARDAALVVVGTHGRNAFGRLLTGSVSRGMLDQAACPVAVIHAGAAARMALDAPILLGIDDSPATAAATDWAFDEASRRGVDLIALHALSDVDVSPVSGLEWLEYQDEAERFLVERLAGYYERYPAVHVHLRLLGNTPVQCLLEEARNSQMVVVGTDADSGFLGIRGRSLRSLHPGSVGAKLAQTAQVPVITFPGRLPVTGETRTAKESAP